MSRSCSSGRFHQGAQSPGIEGERTENPAAEISMTAPSLCQCKTTLTGQEKCNQEVRQENSSRVADCARSFAKGHWSFRGPGNEVKWHATLAYKPNGAWNRAAEQMKISFAGSGHPVFRGTSPVSGGALKRKERRCITMWNLKGQTCYAVSRIGAKILFSEQKVMFQKHGETCCNRVR